MAALRQATCTPVEACCSQRPSSRLHAAQPWQPGVAQPSPERGHTYVDDDVVSVIARIAADGVEGVHKLGESKLRAIFSGSFRHAGVDAEVGMKEAAVDVEVVAEFGYPIREIARELRERIIEAVEYMAARRVVEVNVYVVDVHVGRVERRRSRELE